MTLEHEIRRLISEVVGPLWDRLQDLEDRMTSAENAQQVLADNVTELTNEIDAVANELASVIQQNQSGNLTPDQVNAALAPIHQRLQGLTQANPVSPAVTTDPTNSPAPDSPVVNPAPDAPTDAPTPDPTVNPVDVNPDTGVTPPNDTAAPTDNVAASETGNDFREDL